MQTVQRTLDTTHGENVASRPTPKPKTKVWQAWTSAELEKFIELYPVTDSSSLSLIFNRNKDALHKLASRLGIKKAEGYKRKGRVYFKKKPRKDFTPKERRYMDTHYATTPLKEMVKTLRRSAGVIRQYARLQGLTKNKNR